MKYSFAFLVVFLFLLSAHAQNNVTLQFEESVHDFGNIKEVDGPVDHTFKFTNTSSTPIQIQNVRASCGCTTPDWTKEEIAVGGEGFVQARYNPRNRPGSFNKSLTVTTSDEKRIVLYIKGNVEPKPRTIEDDFPTVMGGLRVKYRAFNMGKLYTNGTTKREFEVYNESDSAIIFSNNKKVPPYIGVRFSPDTLNSKEKGKIVVDYNAKERGDLGFMTDNVTFYTNEVDSVKNFTVYASLEEYFPPMTKEELEQAPKLVIENNSHDFGKIKQGEKVSTTFILTNKGKATLNIRKTAVSCGCTITKLETEDVEPDQSTKLEVTFDSTARRGNQQKSVTVFSNDPMASTQRIMVKAYVED